MPFVYRPYPEGHAKAGAWFRAYYPAGADLAPVCERMGWKQDIPAGVDVYSEGGTQLQAAPLPEPEPEAKPKPATTKKE
jgi:hypothetical protein